MLFCKGVEEVWEKEVHSVPSRTETHGQDIRIQRKNCGSRILSKLKGSEIRMFRIKISHKVLFLGVTRCRMLARKGERESA